MSTADDELLQMVELRGKLDKIRSQIGSKLANQQQLALILQTIDENLDQQKQEKTPVAYFVSFLSLLDQCCENEEIKDFPLATGAVYFLNLVSPYTSKGLLRPRFSEILTRIAPALTDEKAQAPLIRSSIGFLESLLLAQDLNAWNNVHNYKISPKRGLTGLLELSLDSRPKVRKGAQEAVHNILSQVPAGPMLEHPASYVAGEFALNHLISIVQENQSGKNPSKEVSSKLIHNLQLIASIANGNAWPLKQISPLCDILLEICKSADEFLVSSAFSVFEGLFQSMNSEIDNDRFVRVLDIIFDLKPSINDPHLAPSWLAVVAKAVTCYSHNIDPLQCFLKLPQVFKTVGTFFESEVQNVYISASQCLIAIASDAIDAKLLLLPPVVKESVQEQVETTIASLADITNGFLSIKYRQCAKEVAELISSLFTSLSTRANPYFLQHLETVGEWRSNEQEGFELNDVAERVIASAITSIGPELVLQLLPLNLNNPNAVGRAWLLPILRDSVRCAHLGYYIEEILPLTSYFEGLIAKGNSESINSKIFATIVDQIWSLLPAFCDLPFDLVESFTDELAAHLSELLYQKVELRPTICHALRTLVESNVVYSSGDVVNAIINQQFPVEKSKEAIEYISSSKSTKLLSVLFNVFAETPMDQRNYILETIDAYLQISSPEDVSATFNKVCTLLKKALDEEKEDDHHKTEDPAMNGKIPRLSITMMDLVVEMTKYIPESSHTALLAIFNQTIRVQDVQIQKRSYRVLLRLMETEDGLKSVKNFLPDILKVLSDASQVTLQAAKSARLLTLVGVVKSLSVDYLHFIPNILSEVILGTKSVNEKARETSYGILIAMGHKLIENEGSPVKNSLNDSDMPDSEASLKELFVMCSAGLAGGSPHMISASVTALSRIFYEFHDEMPVDFLKEMASTVELFLTSRNREIIKSALGFLKVSSLMLPEDEVRPGLKGLLASLLAVNHEQKSHFRSKIKHLIERMVRRFGMNDIEQCIPEEDKKLIVNIRKTKARAKRKKAESAVETDTIPKAGEEVNKKFTSGYDEALYGDTDSEFEEEGADEEESYGTSKRTRQYISESRDIPLDLLDKRSLAHISSSRPRKFNRKTSDYATKDGKLVFNEVDDSDPLGGKNSIDAYVEAVDQGPVRGQNNKLKYKKKQRTGDGIDWKDEPEDKSKKSSHSRPNYRRAAGGRVGKPRSRFKAGKKL
ncbi:DEKNAAC103240 [Brettanomyces naardenensis]|uniref:DEKNAAC103240 n=1 Tax=Brettanomyces naardenensis TaxID=13370 RepID=A0A448YMR6_BRENA|nr:DEKNAAC103240 [Brettanomyces naardenensis]